MVNISAALPKSLFEQGMKYEAYKVSSENCVEELIGNNQITFVFQDGTQWVLTEDPSTF